MGAKAAAEFNCYALKTGIIDSSASSTFATSTDKTSNAMILKKTTKDSQWP